MHQRAYAYQCSICGFDWALCALHHDLFDQYGNQA
jgi:hypothetical protein